MDRGLNNTYYMLTAQQSVSGTGGNTIWWFDTKLDAIEEIINYFEKARLAFEYLEDDDPEKLEDFDEVLKMLRLQGESTPDNIIRSISLEDGDSIGVTIFGQGKETLFEILNELKQDIEYRCFNDEEVDYEDWFLALLQKIEEDDLTIYDDLEKLNDELNCG